MISEEQALSVLQAKVPDLPKVLITLGTGWNKVLDQAEIELAIPYSELFGVETTVPGHEGQLLVAKIFGRRVTCMQGRFHMYEGYSAFDATMPLRVLKEAGIHTVVLTSAVGAVNEKFKVGDIVILSDMITLFLSHDSPLSGPQFLDLSEPFNEKLRAIAKKVSSSFNIPHREGVYTYLKGPHFETAADKMALKILGTDVVGMSTVPETIMAKWLGLQVLGISYVTNLAFVKHSHEDVVSAAEDGAQHMVNLLSGLIATIS